MVFGRWRGVRDPNGRAYNRTSHLAERRKMMQVWADYDENILLLPELNLVKDESI